jgi:hypothetical protein
MSSLKYFIRDIKTELTNIMKTIMEMIPRIDRDYIKINELREQYGIKDY